MGFKSLLRLGYAGLVVQGLLSVFLPRKAIKLATTGWRAGFENVDELEPREWYVEMTKILGVGMLAAGLTGLLVSRAEKEGADRAQAAFEVAGESGAEETAEDDDDGPVTVDIDDDE